MFTFVTLPSHWLLFPLFIQLEVELIWFSSSLFFILCCGLYKVIRTPSCPFVLLLRVFIMLCWLPLTNAFQQPLAQLLGPSMAQWPGRFLGTTLPLLRHLLVDIDEPPLWPPSSLLSLMLMEGHFTLKIQVSLCFAGIQQ